MVWPQTNLDILTSGNVHPGLPLFGRRKEIRSLACLRGYVPCHAHLDHRNWRGTGSEKGNFTGRVQGHPDDVR